MTATRPKPVVVRGRFVQIEPFDPSNAELGHLDGLWESLVDPRVFAGGYGGGPAGLPADRAAFDEWAVGYGVAENSIRFVVRLVGGDHDGKVVGASTLGDFDDRLEHAHIGWTGYDPRVWSTQVNPETKLLMLGVAFDHGYGRVKLQADSRNDRSRGAITKLGAQFEGVLRRDRLRADGEWSGTAVFSILVDEWPTVKAGLEGRLEAWGDTPVEFRER